MFCQLPITIINYFPTDPQLLQDQLAKGTQFHVQIFESKGHTLTDEQIQSLPNLRCLSWSWGELQITHFPAHLCEVHLERCIFIGRTSTELLADFIADARLLKKLFWFNPAAMIDENVIIEKLMANRRHFRTLRELEIRNGQPPSIDQPAGTVNEQSVRFIRRPMYYNDDDGVAVESLHLQVFRRVFWPGNRHDAPFVRTREVWRNLPGEDLNELEKEQNQISISSK